MNTIGMRKKRPRSVLTVMNSCSTKPHYLLPSSSWSSHPFQTGLMDCRKSFLCDWIKLFGMDQLPPKDAQVLTALTTFFKASIREEILQHCKVNRFRFRIWFDSKLIWMQPGFWNETWGMTLRITFSHYLLSLKGQSRGDPVAFISKDDRPSSCVPILYWEA